MNLIKGTLPQSFLYLLIGIIFLLDVFTPVYFAIWLLYVVPLFLTIWTQQPRVKAVGIVVSVAIFTGLFFSPNFMIPHTISVLNRTIGITLIWMMVYVIQRGMEWREKMVALHASLEERVTDRTKDLQIAKQSLENSLQNYIVEIERINSVILERESTIIELERRLKPSHGQS